MADCHEETVKRAYLSILNRVADPGGLAAYANLLRTGQMTEIGLLDNLVRSVEYQIRNPPLCGGGPPPPDEPPPIPPPGSGAIKSLTLSSNRRGLLLNGSPYTIASHGNVVTAIPGHQWEDDVALQVSHGETYARLWHILSGDTPPTNWPWAWNGSKWDLSRWNEAYWTEKFEVMEACGEAGIVLEVMLFDRGTGGSQSDFKAHPFHPDNNINGLAGELATPLDFYAMRPKTLNFQLAYVKRWIFEMIGFPGVIAEIDNEYRGDGISWPRKMANTVKGEDSKRLVSHSSLGHDLEGAYKEPSIDIVCKHFGNEGNNTRTLSDYLATHWKLGKVVNIDEFANGLGDKALLRDMCETIVRQGGHFHIEDSQGQADGYGAAKAARAIVAAANPPLYETGPTGPPPACPKEVFRGISFYNASYKSQIWIGHQNCLKQNQKGFPAGVHVAFDSTPQAGPNDPVPPGCPVVKTTWSCVPTVPLKTQPDEPFAMQATFAKPGSYVVSAKGAAGAKTLVVKVV